MPSAHDRVLAAAAAVEEAQAAQQRFGKDWTPPPRARKPKPWDPLTAPPFDPEAARQRRARRGRTLPPDEDAALFGVGLDAELDDAYTGEPGTALSDEELRRDEAWPPPGTPAPGTAPG